VPELDDAAAPPFDAARVASFLDADLSRASTLVLEMANMAATSYAGPAAAMTEHERELIERGLNGWLGRLPVGALASVAGAADPASVLIGTASWGWRVYQLKRGAILYDVARLQREATAATQAQGAKVDYTPDVQSAPEPPPPPAPSELPTPTAPHAAAAFTDL
jgi:hypothetical protein